jgi:hypothetical protein
VPPQSSTTTASGGSRRRADERQQEMAYLNKGEDPDVKVHSMAGSMPCAPPIRADTEPPFPPGPDRYASFSRCLDDMGRRCLAPSLVVTTSIRRPFIENAHKKTENLAVLVTVKQETTRLPVRSALFDQHTGGLGFWWVTTINIHGCTFFAKL